MAVDNGKTQLAADMAEICDDFRVLYYRAKDAWQRYFDNGVSEEVNALATDDTPLDGTPFDKVTMMNTVTFFLEFANMMEGSVVTQGTYRISVNNAAALHIPSE